MRIERWSLAILLAAVAVGPTRAVDLEVRVQAQGEPVLDLQKDDFAIKDGAAREIRRARFVDSAEGLKIYIAVQTAPTTFPRVRQAIADFLASEVVAEGVEVSLGGTPFTSDRETLQGYLEAGPKLVDQTPGSGLARLWDVGFSYQLQGEAAVAPYIELAGQLAAVPGKKAVALFRPELNLDRQGLDTRSSTRIAQSRENLDIDVPRSQAALDRLRTVAVFSRTSFYAVNSAENASLDQAGLNRISNATGGVPVLGTNDPRLVFDRILSDARDYYLLSYDPALKGDGKRRAVKVDVDRKGLKVETAADYYLDFDGLETIASAGPPLLELAAEGADLPVDTAYAFFRGEGGKPLILATAGVPVAEVEAAEQGKNAAVTLSLAGGARDASGDWTARQSRRVRRIFRRKAFASAQKKGDAAIDVTLAAPLPAAGWHEWKTVARDEAARRYGVRERRLWAPDFSRPLATSTLVLSRVAVAVADQAEPAAWGDLLDYGGSRIVPESAREFRVGETILFTYRLYNPPPEMLETPPSVQIALMLDERQLDGISVRAENRIVEGRGEIQYMGALETNGLGPGDYILLSAVPGRNDERQPYVEAQFRLVKK